MTDPTAAPATRLLTAPQVGEILGLSDWSVRALIRSGELPCVRIGRRLVRVSSRALEEYIARGGSAAKAA